MGVGMDSDRLIDGSLQEFANLYDSLADRLYRYLVSLSGSHEDAADALQETFLRLYRRREKLAAVDNVESYCFTIARREFLRSRDTQQSKSIALPLPLETQDGSLSPDFEADELVAKALSRLPEHFREIVELHIYGHLTFREIAEVVNKPQGTVATWYRRALGQMREQLAERSSEGRHGIA